MNISTLEQRHDVQQAAQVLAALARAGLREPAIAAGWTRSLVAGGSTSDIDVSYVGDIPTLRPKIFCSTPLIAFAPTPATCETYEIYGMHSKRMALPTLSTISFSTISTALIRSTWGDGRLHDPTGHGLDDADTKTRRINEYDHKNGRTPTASEEVNVCLENCRWITKFGWTPTPASVTRLVRGTHSWQQLTQQEASYFVDKLATKYAPGERPTARAHYEQHGWGFIFDI